MKKQDKTLVIVESPSKAKTINKYLGDDYIISSSMGHIIDLPKSRLAVDVEDNFKPEYITIRGRAKILNELKKLAKKTMHVLLATDPDREGEAISWHLANALSPKNDDIKRIEFNEITEDAVKEAIKHPRDIDINLVNAQQARRILDRIVGYYISPILWRKIKKGLSAGRVQSVALKIICEREDEIEKFISDEYWTLDAVFTSKGKDVTASLYRVKGEKPELKVEKDTEDILEYLKDKKYTVSSVEMKERKRKALPPYITSKLQQDAASRLNFTSSKTMMIAQQLYEGIDITGEGPVGLITYMRTDSTRIADSAMASLRNFISENYKEKYLPETPNVYKNKKGAQDAHEAIRPSDVLHTPESIKEDLTRDQYRLYNLIWRKFVSAQMTPEVTALTTILIDAGDIAFRVSGSIVRFNGFTVVSKEEKTKKTGLPNIEEGDELDLKEFKPEQHFTSPPPRYNDASLVKFLEESGIGRPSTYAPTINTLIKRYYVLRNGKQLEPTVLGKLINGIMIKHFPTLVSIDFTVNMEEKLDAIEEAKFDWVEMLQDFHGPFKEVVDLADINIEEMKNILDEETGLVCEKCGEKMVKRLGKFGFFLACSGFPDCRNSKPFPIGKCPIETCDGDVVQRKPRKGRPFFACSNYPDCTFMTRETPAEKEECPDCKRLLFKKNIKGQGETRICLNENCEYTKVAEDN